MGNYPIWKEGGEGGSKTALKIKREGISKIMVPPPPWVYAMVIWVPAVNA
jgi:hypothetical protein